MNIISVVLLLAFLFPYQNIYSKDDTQQWVAKWIAYEDNGLEDFDVHYFRKEVNLPDKPHSFPVFVSGDSKYKLYVNGLLVSCGPARGDKEHWNYETLDLSPNMKAGNNILAAVVWNEGKFRPKAIISYRTAFFMQGASNESMVVNTNESWICTCDNSYQPYPVIFPNYYVSSPGEIVDMHKHINTWQSEKCDCSKWINAKILGNAYDQTSTGVGTPSSWIFQKPIIPARSFEKLRMNTIRKASKDIVINNNFIKGTSPIIVPSNSHFKILLDQQFLTNSYFTLEYSGGNNAKISISYQEALFSKYPHKGNRNDVDGKYFLGIRDSIISNGDANQEFTTLSWRTYRYVGIDVTTGNDKLVLEDVYGNATGYPFKLNASIRTSDEEINRIFQIGWRTASLCAVETYVDCPYYEQLQYWGDGRIEALVSLYNSGDNRLVKNFLMQAFQSLKPEGIIQSRYPSSENQIITPYALFYIDALHDFMMYSNDTTFLKNQLAGTRLILEYFNKYQEADGSLRSLPWWNFTDWASGEGWKSGVAPVGEDGCSSNLDLQLLLAYEYAMSMEENYGMKSYAQMYRQRVLQLKKTIRKKYWSQQKQLFSDREEKDLFSQHANSLAILTKLSQGKEARQIADKLIKDTSLVQATIYFKYYLHSALTMAGLGDKYMDCLNIWRDNIKMGLTTWAETSDVDVTRSDCHAWGASPNIEFFRTVLGIDSASPCFKNICIAPHLGKINKIGGTIPHPNGFVSVDYTHINDVIKACIVLPKSTSGSFKWHGKEYELKQGENKIQLQDK